jgi:hypothetical protein
MSLTNLSLKAFIVISSSMLIGCSGSESTTSISNKRKLDWMTTGNLYKYYSKGECKIESNTDVCIPKESYIEICTNRPSITTSAVQMLGHSNSTFAAISQSGVSLSYLIDQNSESPCLIKVTADGVVRGSSTAVTVVAEPANFAIDDGGKLFITYAIYRYAE